MLDENIEVHLLHVRLKLFLSKIENFIRHHAFLSENACWISKDAIFNLKNGYKLNDAHRQRLFF